MTASIVAFQITRIKKKKGPQYHAEDPFSFLIMIWGILWGNHQP